MRKYDKKNKRNIGIILVISIIIIIIFSYFIYRNIKTSRIEYNVLSGSILYDNDKTIMKLDNDASIKIKWNKQYYLVYNDDNYLLGKNSVIYNPNNGKISLYGKYYDIKSDAKVDVINGENILQSSAISHFYKIDDRKYLLVASSIYTEDNQFNTNNYLLVELDKLGNAILYNNDVNLKTFAETVLVTNDYSFDIANEVLTYGKNKINLKKIIGSTNEYTPNDVITDGEGSLDGSGEGNGEGSGEGGSGIGEGAGGNGNATAYAPPNGGGDNSNVTDILELSKRTSVIRVIPNITSIAVDYVVYDPKGEYLNVYVDVVNLSKNTSMIVYLDKNNTNTSINNLVPDNKYRLDFYYEYSENGEVRRYNYNSIEVTTKVPLISLSLTDVTASSVGYTIKLDGTYNIDSVTMELLMGNEVVDTYTKTNLGSVSSISDSISINDVDKLANNIITLRISNIVFEGNSYNPDAYYKFRY